MKTILFQGDSITDCDRLRNENSKGIRGFAQKLANKRPLGKGYPAMVAAALDAENAGEYAFINRGVSGDRVPDIYARIVRDIINIKPDYISILVGVNDVWHGFDWGNGTGKERFEKVYDILIEEIKAELPGTKIMLLEPFVLEGSATADREDQPERYKKFRSGVEKMAAIAEKIAKKHEIKFVPLQAMLEEAAKNTSAASLLSDGVHPTAEGHELIKREWIKAFNEIK